jgi:DNA-directed RNA polymerase specialized sigma24 family protein
MSCEGAPEAPASPDDAADAAIAQLPAAYRLAFHLREGGAPTSFIAEQLGIEPEAVGPLLTLAASKLHALRHPPPHPPDKSP